MGSINNEYIQINNIGCFKLIDKTMKFSGIYAIYNKINGKLYIGSSYNVYKRKNEHYNDLKNNRHYNFHLQNAYNINNNFVFVLIESIKDKNILFKKEQYWMDITNCYNNNYGYNISKISNNSLELGRKKNYSESCKKKVYQYHLNGQFIKEWKSAIDASLEGDFNAGQIRSCCLDKTRRKTHRNFQWSYIETNNIGNVRLNYKTPIVQLSLTSEFIKEWEDAQEASDYYNLKTHHILRCCNKERKTYNNCIWLYKKDYINNKIYKIDRKKNVSRKIAQLTIDNKLVKIWNNIKEIMNELNIKFDSGIRKCCSNKLKTHKGFKWQFIN